MKKNDRLEAIKILTRLFNDKVNLSHLLHGASPLTKELCFGLSRHYFRLEHLASLLIKTRPTSLEIWLCLLLGLYQLHFLSIKEYAAVAETVALLDALHAKWAKGFINAVLRRFCRERASLTARLETHLTFQYGHPDWLMTRLATDWPNDWPSICLENDKRAPMSLRINARFTTQEGYLSMLKEQDIEATPHTYSPYGLTLSTPCDVKELPQFSEGWISVQDEAAQCVLPLLELSPSLRVLDACCAPGGKTCHILETQPHLSACVALDEDSCRMEKVKDNLKRLQLTATLLIADATCPETWWDQDPFDRILLDAPCSATGVIRRHPDIKLLRTEADIKAVMVMQYALLNALWPLLKVGGLFVYTTCSILPAENELQIAKLVQHHPDALVLPWTKDYGHRRTHGAQILPGEHQMDGFYYCVLKKVKRQESGNIIK